MIVVLLYLLMIAMIAAIASGLPFYHIAVVWVAAMALIIVFGSMAVAYAIEMREQKKFENWKKGY